MKQVDAADARMELDLRIGAAFTRYQTLLLQPKFPELSKKLISYGSCQFPTLGFVVDRYWKVKNFVMEPFWSIQVTYEKQGETVKFIWKRNHVFDRILCMILYERCVENPLTTVRQVESKPTKKWRPLPLTTVELQKSGSRLLKMTSDEIMKTAESLYTNGYISYPRTETDIYVDHFDLKSLIERQINDTVWGDYARALLNGSYRPPRKGKKNDKSHPPIHPTKCGTDLAGSSKKLFEFITRHFLATCSDDAKGHSVQVTIEISGEIFEASGKHVYQHTHIDIIISHFHHSLMALTQD
jgi:DNA topoisomerase-3